MNADYKNDSLFDLHIDDTAKSHLRTAATWARIIAIIGFISYGISLLVAFFGKSKVLTDGEYTSVANTSNIVSTIISVVIGVCLNIFLLRFATHTKEAVDRMHQHSLENGLNGLRTYFKIIGIILIIALVLFGIMFLLALLAGGMRA